MMNGQDDRQWLLGLLERYGRNLHSFMVLEPGLNIWRREDAAIAYVQRGGYWVTVGGPLCAVERSVEIAESFRRDAAQAGYQVVFFGVTEPLVDRLKSTSFDALQIGLAPAWQPKQWSQVISQARKLRNRLNKAARDGIQVRMIGPDEIQAGTSLRQQIVQLANAWAASKALPPMGFMVTLELFQHAERRRYFIAEKNHQLHGLAVCIPVYGRNGWLLEDMLIAPDAPSGCSEALIDAVMRRLDCEQAEFVSLGLVALAGLEDSRASQAHPWLARFLRVSARTMGWLYNFEGLYRFRNKMQPTRWEPVYIVAGSPITFFTIRAILMAFAQGWVPRFGLYVLRHWLRRRLPPAGATLKSTSTTVETSRPNSAATGSTKPRLDWRTVSLALVSISLVVLAVLGYRYAWLPAWLSVLLGSLGAYTGFTPVHEAVHGNVSRWPAVNNLIGHLCSALLTGAYQPYVYLHREHHLHTNDGQADPDIWCGQGTTWLLPLRWATQDIGYLQFYCRHWTARPVTERANLVACACLYLGIFLFTAAYWPTWFIAVCVGWFVPARLALFVLAATFSWLPHEPHQDTSPLRATAVRSSAWLTWTLLGQNFHLVHHLNPGIPFYRLTQAWQSQRSELLKAGAEDRSRQT